MQQTKLIATYSRVSTSNQEEQKTIQTQLLTLKEFSEKNNYTIVREYTDDGWSGDVLARPALDKLRHEAKKKLWDAVLVYDPDRLARRYSYQELVMDELKEAGIEVIFVTIAAPKNSEDKILHGVRGLFAEYERAKISERFRLGKLRKIKEGHLLVSEPLYGYRYTPKHDNTHGYYEIEPEEARVVKLIFDWVANEGLTLRKVVKRLQALGVSPRRSKRNVWNTSTLSTLLRNKGYIGQAHWGSTFAVVPKNPTNKEKYRKTKKTSRIIKPEEEWYTIPIPAIIDSTVFNKAAFQLAENFKLLAQRNKKNDYLLAGKIYCSCGKRRFGEGPQRGKYLYYRCADRVYSFPLPCVCKEKGVNARITDELVWQKVTNLMTSPTLLLQQAERWLRSRKTQSADLIADIPRLEREIEKLKTEEERYNKAYGAGLFTMEQLTEYTIPVREKMSALELQILLARQQQTSAEVMVIPNQNEIQIFCTKVAEFLEDLNFQAKRDIILNVIEKVVGTPNQLQVYGYIPVTVNQNVAFKSNHRYGVNTIRHNDTANETKYIPIEFTIKLNGSH
jgi:site-specific DNA recombinase